VATVLRSEIEIAASPDRVWSILTDFPSYPAWNPFVRRISGSSIKGTRLEAHLQPPGGRGMTFRPTVLAAEPGRELRWLGHLGVSGLFDGEHRFQIEPLGDDRVRFVQEEHFSGLLTPLILRKIGNSTLLGFAAMNEALKARAEQTSTESETEKRRSA
jgi:hypothetical protein